MGIRYGFTGEFGVYSPLLLWFLPCSGRCPNPLIKVLGRATIATLAEFQLTSRAPYRKSHRYSSI